MYFYNLLINRSITSDLGEPLLFKDGMIPAKTLYISNLCATVSYQTLRWHFKKYGKIKIAIKRPSGENGKANAFMDFLNTDVAKT